MALSHPPLLISPFLFLAVCFASSSATATHLSSRLSKPKSPEMTIWDLLELNGLPRGLIPDAVLYYTFDEVNTGRLKVVLVKQCEVRHGFLFQYEPIITGTLKYGSITDLDGIHIYEHRTRYNVHAIIHSRFPEGGVRFESDHFMLLYPDLYFKDIRTCRSGAISSLRNSFYNNFGNHLSSVLY